MTTMTDTVSRRDARLAATVAALVSDVVRMVEDLAPDVAVRAERVSSPASDDLPANIQAADLHVSLDVIVEADLVDDVRARLRRGFRVVADEAGGQRRLVLLVPAITAPVTHDPETFTVRLAAT